MDAEFMKAQDAEKERAVNNVREAFNRGLTASREMTVGEFLDQRIKVLEEQMASMRRLKGGMSRDFLDSGCSVIAALINPQRP